MKLLRAILEYWWYRRTDRKLLERKDLQESLEQMRRGEGREISPEELRGP